MTLLGQFCLWIAILVGTWGAIVGFSGRWQGRPALAEAVIRSVYAVFGLMVVATICLWQGLISHDFNIEYVAGYTSRNLPTYFIVSALWAGQKGSLLFWAVVLSLFSSLAQWLTSARYRAMMPYVAATTLSVVTFFVIGDGLRGQPVRATCLHASRRAGTQSAAAEHRHGDPPADALPGLHQHRHSVRLCHRGPAFQPAGYRLDSRHPQMDPDELAVPLDRHHPRHVVGLRRAGLGRLLGVGSGGEREPAALAHDVGVPALGDDPGKAGDAETLEHDADRGLVPAQHLRHLHHQVGVIASVHSFTQSNVGYFFLAFLVAAAVLSFTLLYTRWDRLEAEVNLESMVSREAAFLFNNLLFVGVAFSVLWGTLFPILSEAVRGTKITVGPPFFNKVNVPMGLLLLALTGIGPLIAWRKASTANLKRQFTWPVVTGVVVLGIALASGMRHFYSIMALALGGFVAGTLVQEFARGTRARHRMYNESYPRALAHLVARNRRRYGGYLVHAGMLIYFVAFTGMAFKRDMEATLKPGDSITMMSPFGHQYPVHPRGRLRNTNRSTGLSPPRRSRSRRMGRR